MRSYTFAEMCQCLLSFFVLLVLWSGASHAATRVGSEFRVNTTTEFDQQYCDVAMSGYGDFVAVWASTGQDGSNWGIFGQRYDASGGTGTSPFGRQAST